MKTRFKYLLAAGIVVIVGVVLIGFFRVDLSRMTFEVALNQLVSPPEPFDSGLHVFICGAGSPMTDPQRSGSCVAVLAGNSGFLFDAGANSSRVLSQMPFPLGRLKQIFITHYHSDHIDGLGAHMLGSWIIGQRQAPIPIAGPEGIETVVDGFVAAYQLDREYRVAHHGHDVAHPDGFGGVALPFNLENDVGVVYESDGVTITAFNVDHRPVMPAVGYRIDYLGRSVVISGDTIKDDRVTNVASNADLLIHEALHMGMVGIMAETMEELGAASTEKILHDIQDYHASPLEAAQVAAASDVQDLVLYHLVPPLRSTLFHPYFLDGIDEVFDGRVEIAIDGLLISLPADSDVIEYQSLIH